MTLIRPETRHVEVDGMRIGYQSYGSGKRTVIGVPGFAQNIDGIWENSESAAFFERLGRFCRVLTFDKRGTGTSDRSIPPPAWGWPPVAPRPSRPHSSCLANG
ncbi:MAG TPA: hypothetical protein VH084_31165 [Mycobacterium sp.]|nr:hypothetical protein [Mycobacterium sp.]